MEEEVKDKICEYCGDIYPESEINEHDLCVFCEEFYQKEKQDIQDTQDSDLRQL